MIARPAIVFVVGALLAVQVVRTASVANPSTRATAATQLWPTHPSVMIDRAMADIGTAAARRQPLSPGVLRRVGTIAQKEPLAPEPFLIEGALAQLQQRPQRAEQLFLAARARDPRSPAARYFLAERYLGTGRAEQALAEMAALSRLFPQARSEFGPALAAFARTPGAVPRLRTFFRSAPEFEPLVLSNLAADARNSDLIMALRGPDNPRTDAATVEWQSKLVNRLIEQGEPAKAHAIWRRIADVNESGGTIFNPGFAKASAPPPFNWTFATTGGVVEPAPGGRLQVIYFGRKDVLLADQILLLAPGRYQLGMDVTGSPGSGGEIAWTVTCLARPEPVLRLPIARKGVVAGNFAIAPGCPAQRLQLTGSPGDFPESQEISIGKLALAKAPGA